MDLFITIIKIGVALLVIYVIASFFAACLFVKAVVTPSGISRRTVKKVRERNIQFGNVDFEPYDKANKEVFMFPVSGGEEGVELSCVLIRAEQLIPPGEHCQPKRETCVIIAHGFAENKDNSVKYAYDFLSMGFHVLLYDHRAFGASTAKYCSMGVYESSDLSALIDETKRRLGEHVAIGLHGESMGSISSFMALEKNNAIEFIVSDCGPTYMRDFSKEAYEAMTHLPIGFANPIMNSISKNRYGFDMDDIRPADGVAKTEIPILFIHGTEDHLVPTRMCPELYKLARNPHSRMVLFEGAGHAQSHYSDPIKYKQEIYDFLKDIDVL